MPLSLLASFSERLIDKGSFPGHVCQGPEAVAPTCERPASRVRGLAQLHRGRGAHLSSRRAHPDSWNPRPAPPCSSEECPRATTFRNGEQHSAGCRKGPRGLTSMRKTPRDRASATISRTSAAFTPMGFSHRTALPAARHSSTTALCWGCWVPM